MATLKQYIPNLGQNANITVGSTELSPNTVQYAQVTFTAAQIQAMNTTPLQVIAAPVYAPIGTNLSIVVTDFSLEVGSFGATSTGYAGGGSATYLTYGTSVAITSPIGTAIFFGTANATTYAQAAATYTVVPNTGIFLTNSTGAFTTGTASVTANVWYAVMAV